MRVFAEHVIRAAAVTVAALDGREAEFKPAAGALDANSVDIAKAIGSVYGAGAEQAFLPLWRRQIGFAVDYTVGVATKDQPKQQKAIGDLIAYSEDFAVFGPSRGRRSITAGGTGISRVPPPFTAPPPIVMVTPSPQHRPRPRISRLRRPTSRCEPRRGNQG